VNILLVTPLYSQHWDSGWFWLRALNQLGHAVSVWDYRLDRKPPQFFRLPDVTLVLKGEGIDPKIFPSPKLCYWPDALERTPGVEEVLMHYDKVFTPVRPTPDWMEWLPTGWDPAIHRDLGTERATHSVYIGTFNSKQKLDKITSIGPQVIAGNGWEQVLDRRHWRTVPERVGHGSRLLLGPHYLHDFVRLANQAKVLIDVHQNPKVGLNRKLFEMIACGFTIVDDVPGVREVLGDDVYSRVCFRSPLEARNLIEFYLEHIEEREKLWQLQKQSIQKYTYLETAKKVLSYLK